MALITCSQCGRKISDKSSQCIHCGAPVLLSQKCEECGTRYPQIEKVCPNCGCPSKKNFTFSTEREKEIEMFLLLHTDYYPPELYNEVKSWLMTVSEKQLSLIYDINYRDSVAMLFVSIFLGYIGLDRFLLKDTKKGLMKLGMTCFSFLIIPGIIAIAWWIKDIINIKEMVREYNYNEMKSVPNIV